MDAAATSVDDVTPHAGEVAGLDAAALAAELSPDTVASSAPFVGQWSRLVSTTNWEKGRIICEWRVALERKGARVTECSDEAWAQLVGHVTSQHVGRLRRVSQRFGKDRDEYEGLYWSHFQAALDWDDAEMWLEGAIASRWSVSQMRAARWEAVGAPGDEASRVIETEIDEDSYQSLTGARAAAEGDEAHAESDAEGAEATARKSPAAADESASWEDSSSGDSTGEAPKPRVRPFAAIGALPDDVADAFEQFKLVILSHKLTGWEQIGRDDLVACLEALKALVLAPAAED